MPKKTAVKPTVTETVAAELPSKPRATRTKTPRTAPVVEVASKPRVKTVKHSKAAVAVITETVVRSAHEQIAEIAYGYWEARSGQHGNAEQDWLRAEQEYLQRIS